MNEPSLESYHEWRKQPTGIPYIRMYGMPIIESEYLTNTKETKRPRTWRERLFSWPWRPWEKTKTVYVQVPKQEFFIVDNKIVCHPAIAQQLRDAIEAQ